MVLMPVLCPHCHSNRVIKGGKTKAGQQRYKCQNTNCPRYSFQLDLLNPLHPDDVDVMIQGVEEAEVDAM